MKILHLADLHIGKAVHGFSMIGDQEYIFAQILDYIRERRPDAVVIAGDVYDRSAPSPDAVRTFDRFLTSLAASGQAVAVISGNHDSPERLSFASGIMRESNVHMYGVFDGRMRVVSLRDAYGEARIHLLPYVRPSEVRRFAEAYRTDAQGAGRPQGNGSADGNAGEAGEPQNNGGVNGNAGEAGRPQNNGGAEISTYQDAVAAVIGAAGIDASVRNILVAHQYFAAEGSDPERSESERETVGGTDRIDIAACGAAGLFDYVALGHLHGPQRIGSERVRYAGSPLKYSFSECYHNKCALLVELRGKGDLTVEALPLRPLRDMRRIRGPLAALLGEDVKASGDCEDYLHVTLTDEDEVFDARGKLRAAYPNVMQLDFDNARTNAGYDVSVDEEIRQSTPASQFEEFYLKQNGTEMNAEQRKAVADFLNLDADGEQ